MVEKMSDYNKLKQEFEHKVVELQKTCKHKDISKWMDYYWAPAHSTGYKVKICLNCNKEIKRKKK